MGYEGSSLWLQLALPLVVLGFMIELQGFQDGKWLTSASSTNNDKFDEYESGQALHLIALFLTATVVITLCLIIFAGKSGKPLSIVSIIVCLLGGLFLLCACAVMHEYSKASNTITEEIYLVTNLFASFMLIAAGVFLILDMLGINKSA